MTFSSHTFTGVRATCAPANNGEIVTRLIEHTTSKQPSFFRITILRTIPKFITAATARKARPHPTPSGAAQTASPPISEARSSRIICKGFWR